MNSDYVAWNGERYVWPPPDGWYLASDGRWWAPDTGPDMGLSLDAAPAGATASAEPSTESGVDNTPAIGPTDSGGETVAAGGETSPVVDPMQTVDTVTADSAATPAGIDSGATAGADPDPGQEPDFGSDPPPTEPLTTGGSASSSAGTANYAPSAFPGSTGEPAGDRTVAFDPGVRAPADGSPMAYGSPTTGQYRAITDTDSTTAMPSTAPLSSPATGPNPTVVMTAETPLTRTGPHTVVPADPEALLDTQRPSVLETEAGPSAKVQRSRTMPMIAAGLLVAAAIVIAALLALVGGDNETQDQQPSASSTEVDDGSGQLVVDADGSAESTTEDGMADDGDAMGEDGDAMDEDSDAMTEEDQASTSTTADTVGGSDTTVSAGDAALIGQFRTLLEENQITAAGLTGDDLVVFGDTACSYSTSATDLADYQQIRNEALAGAQNDELTVEELQFVVDAAVTVFCPEDATRLGIEATAPAT